MFGNIKSFQEVDKILAVGGPLYIRNRARHKLSGALSILAVNYDGSEGKTSFNLPRTSIPFDICNFVEPEGLRGSKDFRRLVLKGIIEIVDQKEAEAELADPETQLSLMDAIAESDEKGIYQVRASENHKTKAAERTSRAEAQLENNVGLNHLTAMGTLDPRMAAALAPTAENIVNVPPPPQVVNPRFTALEARATSMAPADVVAELRKMYGDLTDTDLQAVASSSTWPFDAQQWARERIAYRTQASSTKGAE